jgi:hypothetical protein
VSGRTRPIIPKSRSTFVSELTHSRPPPESDDGDCVQALVELLGAMVVSACELLAAGQQLAQMPNAPLILGMFLRFGNMCANDFDMDEETAWMHRVLEVAERSGIDLATGRVPASAARIVGEMKSGSRSDAAMKAIKKWSKVNWNARVSSLIAVARRYSIQHLC